MINYVDQEYDNPRAFNFLKNNEWHSISSKEFTKSIRRLALSLQKIGLEKDQTLGIMANPSPIWLMFNFASISCGGISVPIFANISSENLLFQIKDAKINFFFCDSKKNLQFLLESKVKFKKIITFGFKSNKRNKNIISVDELLNIGGDSLNKNQEPYKKLAKKVKKQDIATIIYTSGSTGTPKGVEITHDNLVTQIKGADKFFPLKHNQDIALSFLPLAHIFEGMVMSFYISKGICIYFADDPKNIGNLLKEIKPTIMTVVPRMLEKTYAKMNDGLMKASFLKKAIGNLAFKLALKTNPDIRKVPLNCLFKKLVYQKLTDGLGGNLRMMICGGAPVSKNLEQFFNNIGINLFIGYGLTETSPVISANQKNAKKIGTVGKVFPNIKVKIQDGELLAKGPCVMKGYHNNKAKTNATIDKNGWLKTGDLASIDNDGFITILGRKKELFKTAGGKYVSPVPIEQKLLQYCPFLSAALVIAEGRKCVCTLLFPDFENLETHKKRFRMSNLNDKEFLTKEVIQNKIRELINKINQSLNDWEKIRKFELILDELSIENGDLTPSMKLKRSALEKKYHNIIDKFYL